MATVSTNLTTSVTRSVTRPNLVIGGRVTDADGAPAAVDLQLTVALEAVVADGAASDVNGPTVYDVYGVQLRSDADGRFADSYDVADDVRAVLIGWVKCTVQLQVQGSGRPFYTKAVRWMRPTSDELIPGLSGLIGDVRIRS